MFECILDNVPFKMIGTRLLVSSAVDFFTMGIDKARAVCGDWRIPEKTLFVVTVVGGSFGVALGSVLFHHKTSKLSFLIVVYAAAIVWLFALQRIGFLSCILSSIPR